MDNASETPLTAPVGRSADCVCCGVGILRTPHRQPLCAACVSPRSARSYCAKCGRRDVYHPYEDFMRVMAEHYPHLTLGTDIAVRLPACSQCNQDGSPPVGDGLARFYGITE